MRKKSRINKRGIEKSLTTYSAAAGALLAANHAGAEVIHTDLEDMLLLGSEEFTLNFELPGGTYGVTLGATSIFSTTNSIYRAFATGAGQRAVDGGGLPLVLSFGQNIRTAPTAAGGGFGGGTLLAERVWRSWTTTSTSFISGTTSSPGSTTTFTTTSTTSSTTGNFAGQNNVYLGLKVTDDATDYYGWAQISVNDWSDEITLHSWAYENQGNDITAGQAIPEPGHIGLLAAGAAGLLAWRRKRGQAREEAGSEAGDA